MTPIADPLAFAHETFGNAELGDFRRTRRLIDAVAAMAAHPGASIPAACGDDEARIQGIYKFIRNDAIEPTAISTAVFDSTARLVESENSDLLLIQDTTSISPVHALRDELRSKQGSPAGYLVHTGLLVEAERGVPIGVLGQLVWNRKTPKSKKLMKVESEKWQRLDEQTQRCSIDQSRLIRICDRESDFLEYLEFLQGNHLRFVLRAAQDRKLADAEEFSHVWDAARAAPIVGTRTIEIEQRGAQTAGLEQNAREARTKQQLETTIQVTTIQLNGVRKESPKISLRARSEIT